MYVAEALAGKRTRGSLKISCFIILLVEKTQEPNPIKPKETLENLGGGREVGPIKEEAGFKACKV